MLAAMAAVYTVALEGAPNRWALATAVIVGLLALIGTWTAFADARAPARVRPVDVITATVCALATLYLSRNLGIAPLGAAAGVTASLGVAAIPAGAIDEQASQAGFAGAFVGIITPNITVPWYWVALSGVIAGVLWSMACRTVLQGAGGRIGMVAFMGSALAYGVADLFGDRGNAVLLPPTGTVATWAVVPVGIAGVLVPWMLYRRAGWPYATAVGVPALAVCGGIGLAGLGVAGPALAATWLGGGALAAVSSKRLPNAGWLFLAAFLYGGLMVSVSRPVEGHVGTVGVLATIAVLATVAIRRLLRRMPLPDRPTAP